jgi:WD40 repeat protein
LRDEWQHAGILTLSVSGNGKVVAAADSNAVTLRDGDTSKLRATVRPEQMADHKSAAIRRVALSPEGDLLAMALQLDQGHELVVWDVKEGRQQAAVRLPRGESATCLAFSPDGKKLAAALFAGACVALYESRELKEVKRVARQKASVNTVAFSPDGKTLATSSFPGQVAVWDLAEDRELWHGSGTLAHADRQPLVFSPDGKWLVAATRGRMVLLDAATGKVRAKVTKTPNASSAPAFSPDGKYLAVVRVTNMPIVVYDVEKLLAAPAP